MLADNTAPPDSTAQLPLNDTTLAPQPRYLRPRTKQQCVLKYPQDPGQVSATKLTTRFMAIMQVILR